MPEGGAQPTAPERSGPYGGAHPYDWERLERAVKGLVAEQRTLREQNESLRNRLTDREGRIRGLEAKLIEANQLRQDTAKRLDELISELDQLDEQLASVEPGE